MDFPAQTRADLQALAAWGRPVLATAAQMGPMPERIFANRAAVAALTGADGQQDWTVLDGTARRSLGVQLRRFLAPYPDTPTAFPLMVATPQGLRRWRMASWRLASAHDAMGLVAVAADADKDSDTEDIEAAATPLLAPDAERCESEDGAVDEELAALETVARAGRIRSDPARGTLHMSAGARRIWGLTGDVPERTLGDLLARVHPEDLPDLLASESAEDCNRREFRVLGPTDSIVYVRRTTSRSRNGLLHIDRDITKFRLLERELITTRAVSDVAARSKAEFLALMSHELRTPLNAVMGFAQVMAAEMLGPMPERYRDYSKEITVSAERLLTVINDILDLTRIEAARVQVNKEWLDLGRSTTEASQMMLISAAEKNLSVKFRIEPGIRIWAEARAIRQLVLNLISNAVKFTDPGGSIEIAVRRGSEDSAVLEVRDTGIGIPPEEVSKVWAPFVQASNATARAAAGTGLGLAIVKALADMHSGVLSIASELDRGTTVTLTIPPAFQVSRSAAS